MKRLMIVLMFMLTGCGGGDGEPDKTPPKPTKRATAPNGQEDARRQTDAAQADVNARDEDGMTPLHRAAIEGELERIRALVKAGADVGAESNEGNTPLHAAAYQGHPKAAELLIEAGADVNARNRHAESVLHMAAYGGEAEIVRLLLEARAAPNPLTGEGETPLDWADDRKVRDLLRKHGAKTGKEVKAQK